jgi:hypothetical protein
MFFFPANEIRDEQLTAIENKLKALTDAFYW